MPQSDVARTLLVAPPRPRFFPQMHQSVHDVFVRLKTRVVNSRREEDVEQEGRKHVPLTEALFQSDRAHRVVEPHALLHAILELTNDRGHRLWHPKTGEYCPKEGSVNGLVRFGKVAKQYIQRIHFFRANSCSRRITNIISVVERFGRKPLCSSDRTPTRSQYSLRWRARIFSSILPACTASEIPL